MSDVIPLVMGLVHPLSLSLSLLLSLHHFFRWKERKKKKKEERENGNGIKGIVTLDSFLITSLFSFSLNYFFFSLFSSSCYKLSRLQTIQVTKYNSFDRLIHQEKETRRKKKIELKKQRKIQVSSRDKAEKKSSIILIRLKEEKLAFNLSRKQLRLSSSSRRFSFFPSRYLSLFLSLPL